MAQNWPPNLSFKHGRQQSTKFSIPTGWLGRARPQRYPTFHRKLPHSETLKVHETLLSRRLSAFPKDRFRGILLAYRGAGFSNSPRQPEANGCLCRRIEARSPAGSPNPGKRMDERDHRGNDSDSPTMPGTRLPGDVVGAGALTPPPLSNAPLSDAPTLPQGTPLPGASPAPRL